MRASFNGTVIAEVNESDLIRIEGNWYFPASSVDFALLKESPTAYTCPWKGQCQYYNIVLDGVELPDAAWSYPTPYPRGLERVGKDFSGHVAFGKEVRVD